MKRLLLPLFVIILSALFAQSSHAQINQNLPKNEFERGKVIKVLEEGSRQILDTKQPYQTVEIEILTGQDNGKKNHC